MKEYYVPINGSIVVEANNEDEALEKARNIVVGFDYDCGDVFELEDEDEEE